MSEWKNVEAILDKESDQFEVLKDTGLLHYGNSPSWHTKLKKSYYYVQGIFGE